MVDPEEARRQAAEDEAYRQRWGPDSALEKNFDHDKFKAMIADVEARLVEIKVNDHVFLKKDENPKLFKARFWDLTLDLLLLDLALLHDEKPPIYAFHSISDDNWSGGEAYYFEYRTKRYYLRLKSQ